MGRIKNTLLESREHNMEYQDLLIEIGVEELPTKSIPRLAEEFGDALIEQLRMHGLIKPPSYRENAIKNCRKILEEALKNIALLLQDDIVKTVLEAEQKDSQLAQR